MTGLGQEKIHEKTKKSTNMSSPVMDTTEKDLHIENDQAAHYFSQQKQAGSQYKGGNQKPQEADPQILPSAGALLCQKKLHHPNDSQEK